MLVGDAIWTVISCILKFLVKELHLHSLCMGEVTEAVI